MLVPCILILLSAKYIFIAADELNPRSGSNNSSSRGQQQQQQGQQQQHRGSAAVGAAAGTTGAVAAAAAAAWQKEAASCLETRIIAMQSVECPRGRKHSIARSGGRKLDRPTSLLKRHPSLLERHPSLLERHPSLASFLLLLIDMERVDISSRFFPPRSRIFHKCRGWIAITISEYDCLQISLPRGSTDEMSFRMSEIFSAPRSSSSVHLMNHFQRRIEFNSLFSGSYIGKESFQFDLFLRFQIETGEQCRWQSGFSSSHPFFNVSL